MRTMQKSVTFDKDEKQRIEEAANKYGLSYCAFIRNASLKEAERVLGRIENE